MGHCSVYKDQSGSSEANHWANALPCPRCQMLISPWTPGYFRCSTWQCKYCLDQASSFNSAHVWYILLKDALASTVQPATYHNKCTPSQMFSHPSPSAHSMAYIHTSIAASQQPLDLICIACVLCSSEAPIPKGLGQHQSTALRRLPTRGSKPRSYDVIFKFCLLL